MRKIIAIAGLAAVALLVWAQSSGSGLLSAYSKALNSAQSLTVNYTLQRIGSTKEEYTVSFAKPNMVRIDKANEMIVADGKTITTYDKTNKTYFKRPQTEDEMKDILSSDEFSLWMSFFDANLYAKTPSKMLGTRNHKGMTLNTVETSADSKGRKIVTLYLSQGDNLARQAQIVMIEGSEKISYVLDTKSITLGTTADANTYAFKAPEGSRELTAEELNSDKWYTDLEEAKKVAERTKRILLVDFYADW
jgi:outer membrane lipoprotein-sorting protein